MVRTLTAAAQTEAAKTHGTEPITVIEVQWTNGGKIYSYADTRYGDHIKGLIVSMSDIDAVIQVSDNSDSSQVSVTLDDTDGALRDIINQNDIHQRPVWVYQHFAGLDESDRVLLFQGKISSPIVWDEGDRTLAFDVITEMTDQEVGFSIEEGSFTNIAQEIAGKPWPLAFGKVRNVPALQVRTGVRGYLRDGFGIVDPTILPRKAQTAQTCCPIVKVGETVNASAWITGAPAHNDIFGEEPNCLCRNQADIIGLQSEYDAQLAFQPNQISVVNGALFPQGEQIYLKINDATLLGQFTGDTFNIQGRTHPALNTLTIPPLKNFDCGETSETPPKGYQNRSTCIVSTASAEATTPSQESYNYLAEFPTSSFFWAEAGSEVHYISKADTVYIANLLPSTIYAVKAYRTFSQSGSKRLVTVPRSYYTTRQVDYGGYQVMEIVMDKPLSLRSEGWEDDIFVTMESTVGPDAVDVLEWVIDRYTDFSVDTDSFEAVRTAVTNMPTNFALLRRKRVSDFLREFAYQIRCAVYIRNNTVYLKFLPSLGDSESTLTQSGIVANTLKMSHTPTEDLVTKYVAEWTDDYSLGNSYEHAFSLHVAKYGVREETFDYWALSHATLIRRSAHFWLVRLSQTWRLLELSTSLGNIKLDVFDTVSVNLSDFSPYTIDGCLIEEARLNSESHEIGLRVWTPVLAGTQVSAAQAHPADITEGLNIGSLGPGDEAVPNTDVVAPEGSYLAVIEDSTDNGWGFGGGTNQEDDCGVHHSRLGLYDRRPDHCFQTEDETPNDEEIDESPIGGGAEPPSRDGSVQENPFSQEDADTGSQASKEENEARGDSEDNQDALDNLPNPAELDGCFVTVTIFWETVTAVQKEGGGCTSDQTKTGIACYGSDAGTEHIAFNSEEEANAFAEQPSLYQIPRITNAQPGGLYPAGFSVARDWGPQCEEPDESSVVGYGSNGDGHGNFSSYSA